MIWQKTRKKNTLSIRYLYGSDITNSNSNSTLTQHNNNNKINKDELNKIIHLVVNYLNLKTAKNFKANTKNTVKHITARLKEGFTFDNFKTVIDVKVKEWANNKEMSKYLRPETLFGTKFESYLNQECDIQTEQQNEAVNEYIEMSRRFDNGK